MTPAGALHAATRLRPRVSIPLAMAGAALFFTWIAGTLVALGLWETAWGFLAMVVALGLGALSLWSSALAVTSRRAGTIEIGPDAIVVQGTTIARPNIIAIRRYADLGFKGTRIDLADGGIALIPAHAHSPRRLMRTFRRYGYSVAD